MPTSIEKLNTLIEYIAQSGFDCGVFQQRLQEIASEDPGIVNISSPKGSLLGAATKEMNIPAIKVLLECDAIKIDTVTDIIVGNTVTRAMPLHNVIYRLNQTAYSEIEPIVEIIDLFREKWAKSKAQDVGDAAKVTSKIAPLEYATKPEIKELLLLHGVKHKILKSDVQDPIKQLAQKLYDEPKT